MKKVKFAIIGCGRISYRHIEAIQENERAELVALCDLNLDRANERNEKANVHIYQDYNEMLSKEDIDVVNIMTPNGMHAEHAIEIITKYHKHIVVEKPMCLNVEDGENLIKIAKDNQVKLFIVHQNRFNKSIQKIKQAIDSQQFGKIALATVRLRWSRDQSYYNRDPWRGTWALDGGALTNQAVHHIDLLRWLVGDVESVSAIGATQLVDVEVEDTACAWVRFNHGALGIIEATTAIRPNNCDLEASISIISEKGTVIIEGAAVNKITTWTIGDIDKESFSENIPNVYGFGHNDIINNVVDTLLFDRQPLVSGEDAIKSIRLLSAIYRSIELNGKELKMVDKPVSKKFGIITPEMKSVADLYRTKFVCGDK
jgi:UDP-N-acetyl-2-amino-2-deoxyglucuronate dehydrogenase